MSATAMQHAPAGPGGPDAGARAQVYRQPHLARQVKVVARRSVRRTLRQPAAIVPPLLFPLMLLAVNSAGLASAADIPGFPAERYLDFALVVTFMQGALFATTTAGIGLGQDIEQGFLDRLALTPIHGAALVLGQLAGAVLLVFGASMVYVTVGLLAGVEFASGPGGMVALLFLAAATALSFAALGSLLALRTGTAEAVQGLFPVLFAALFLSTMSMPLDLIENGWFHAIARTNPVSYIIDGMRSLIITGWDLPALARMLVVLVGLATVSLAGCNMALRRRLTRT